MKIVITGVTGFLGRHLAAHALACGHEVLGTARTSRPPLFEEEHYDQCVLDILDVPADFKAKIEGAQALVHCAARIHGAPEDVRRSIVEGTRAILFDLRIVYLSSMAAFEAYPGVYGNAKLEAEALVREKASDGVILRPTLIYGRNDTGWTARLKERVTSRVLLPLWAWGGTRIQPVYVGDVVQAVLAAATLPEVSGMTFDLGGPELLPQREFMNMVRRALKGRTRFVPLPLWPLKPFAAASAFYGHDHPVEISPARHQLGFDPLPPSEAIPLVFP